MTELQSDRILYLSSYKTALLQIEKCENIYLKGESDKKRVALSFQTFNMKNALLQ